MEKDAKVPEVLNTPKWEKPTPNIPEYEPPIDRFEIISTQEYQDAYNSLTPEQQKLLDKLAWDIAVSGYDTNTDEASQWTKMEILTWKGSQSKAVLDARAELNMLPSL
jgi:hypothetical protein